ncbi:MAG: hypothetical protein KGL39_36465 [Patescibacteria group bacterium]|nr:hypothetical protein [Patescibacteria group bacterium]
MTDQDQKELFKEAIKEWMDDRAKEVGWWFIRTMLMGGVAFIVYWWVVARGYKFP